MEKIEQNDVVIKSWADLYEKVYEGSWQEDIMRFRSNYALKRLCGKDFKQLTSFSRNLTGNRGINRDEY